MTHPEPTRGPAARLPLQSPPASAPVVAPRSSMSWVQTQFDRAHSQARHWPVGNTPKLITGPLLFGSNRSVMPLPVLRVRATSLRLLLLVRQARTLPSLLSALCSTPSALSLSLCSFSSSLPVCIGVSLSDPVLRHCAPLTPSSSAPTSSSSSLSLPLPLHDNPSSPIHPSHH